MVEVRAIIVNANKGMIRTTFLTLSFQKSCFLGIAQGRRQCDRQAPDRVRCIIFSRHIKGSFGTKLLFKRLIRLLWGWPNMTTLQAICFGAMLAWTPSLIVMALVLWETPLDVLD